MSAPGGRARRSGARGRRRRARKRTAGNAGPFTRFSGSTGVDFTNAYIFRGIVQEDEGFIGQPWAEIDYNVYSSETGFLRDVTIGGGVWSSFHSRGDPGGELADLALRGRLVPGRVPDLPGRASA